MSKQTKTPGSEFGGNWTKQKLIVINDYLNFYTKALGNKGFKLIYIDAFAGSGKTRIKNLDEEIDGSPLIALKYNFDEYYFLELDTNRIEDLKASVNRLFPDKINKVRFVKGDCNVELINILKKLNKKQRGVLFLDPYALELEWKVLEAAQSTHILDIWYLFPLSAFIRTLPNESFEKMPNSKTLNKVLGSNEWQTKLYVKDKQIYLFGEQNYERVDYDSVLKYIRGKLSTCFSYVSPSSKILKNNKRSPLFLLFFIMTNNSPLAIKLGAKVVKDILRKIDDMN